MNRNTGNNTIALLFSVTTTTKNEYAAFMLNANATRHTTSVIMYDSLSVSRLSSDAIMIGSVEYPSMQAVCRYELG